MNINIVSYSHIDISHLKDSDYLKAVPEQHISAMQSGRVHVDDCEMHKQYFEKFLNYAEWGAAQCYKEGKRAGFFEIGGRTCWRFFRTYIIQRGFLDGIHGLVVCGLQAFGVFLKYAQLWEYYEHKRLGEKIILPAFDDDSQTWDRSAEK